MKSALQASLFVLTLAAVPLAAQDKAAPQEFSGFLKNYSQLQPDPNRQGVMLYIRKGDFKQYTKIMFDPIEVWPSPGGYRGIQPDALKRMTDGMLKSYQDALTPDYPIVTAPGPDVLRVRLAITGFQIVKMPVDAIDFLPVKAVFNLARRATSGAPHVVELTGEMEVLDHDNKRVAAALATRKGGKNLPQGEQVTWSHMQAVTDYWAQNFRKGLDDLRGVR
jgi:hypothetical protein